MGRKSRLKREREHAIVEKEEYFGFDKVLLYIIKAGIYLMLLTPLVVNNKFLFLFVAPKGFYLMALIELVFFSWVVLAFRNPRFRPKIDNVFKAFLAFIVVLILSTIFSTDIARSFWPKPERMSGLLMWLHLFPLYLVISSVVRKKDWIKIWISSIGVAIIVCFYFLLEKAGVKGIPVAYWGSTIGNSSFMATYLLFNLFFAIFAYIKAKKEKTLNNGFTKGLIVFGFVSMFFTLMFSTARASILVFFGGMALLALFVLTATKWKKIAKTMIIIGFAVYLLGMGLLHWNKGPVQEYFSQHATRSRQVVWDSAWQGFQDKPILGWGMGNFSFVFHKYFEPRMYLTDLYGPNTRFDRAHNIIFDTMIDAGILGLIAYLSLFFTIFLECFKKYKLKKIDILTAAIPVTILIGHFTQNITVFDMPVSFLMLMLTFGFVTSAGREVSHEGKKIVSPIIPIISGVLLIISFVYFVFLPARSSVSATRVVMSQTFEEREPYYIKAFESSPAGQHQTRIMMAKYLDDMSRVDSVEQGDYEIIIKYLKERVENSPYDYYGKMMLGRTYRLYSKYDPSQLVNAEKFLLEAIKLSPTKQEVYWELAKVKSGLGDQDETYSLLTKAIELEPTIYNSHQLMIIFLVDVNQTDLARQKLEEAKQYMPGAEESLDKVFQAALDRKESI